MKIPLAEHMHTIQGEGMFTGTPMHFIRLPGCNVGVKATKDWMLNDPSPILPILSNSHAGSKCCTYDNRFFDCDTDFAKTEYAEVEQLIEETYEKAICLTGGEPLIHQKQEYFWKLFCLAKAKGIRIHIETSGTIEISSDYDMFDPWIAVAPKYRCTSMMLEKANEVKFLVDEDFSPYSLQMSSMLSYIKGQVFVSAINYEKTVDENNLKLCMDVLKIQPTWRLNLQVHKLIGVR